MNLTQFSDFTRNIALLLSLGLLYDMVISNKRRKHYIIQKIITGLVLTLIGVILMSTPWEFSPGYFFDPRTVLMSISGLFFGYIPTGIAVVFLIFFRIYQGGGGVIPGILWVLIPACSGLLWKKIRAHKNKNYSFWELFIFGLIIHIVVLLALLTLPLTTALSILANVTLPVLLFFPLGTAILGLVLSDRKERKKAQIQVTRLATVIEQLNEKVIITDLDGYPQYLNHYFETSSGYTISEIIGQKLGILKSGYHEKKFYDDLWNTISSGNTWRGQIVNKRKDNTIYYDEATIFPIVDEDGEIINYASFQRDVTDQIKMIEAIKESEENLEIILGSIGDAVLATDIKGNIIKMNPVAENLTGWTSTASEGRQLNSILKIKKSLLESTPVDPVEMVLALGGNDILSDHFILTSREGHDLQISLSGRLVNHNNHLSLGIVFVFRDISDELKMRELMIRNEKMLSIGGLAAGMAHEINNPLAGMMQSAAVIINRLSNKTDSVRNREVAEEHGLSFDALRQYMEERDIYRMFSSINTAGKKIASIIENMISFSQSGKGEKTPFSIPELLDRTLDIAAADFDLKSQYQFKNINVIKHYDPDVPTVLCEGSKIQQVFLNILRNGAQAMEDAEIESPEFNLRISFERELPIVVIEIEDNGPGMTPDLEKRIFEPFFTTKPVGTGTGLGLSVSYYIITEEHKGHLSVVSEPGKGSRVIIRLPV